MDAAGWKAKAVHGAVSAAVLGGCVAAYVAMGSREAPKRRKPPGGGAALIETTAVRAAEGTLTVETRGVVVPAREVRVAAEVAGRVAMKSPSARAGHVVRKGETLLRIEADDYELASERLRRELAARRSELDSLKVRQAGAERLLALAEKDVSMAQRDESRVRRLRSSGAGTTSAADAAERATLTAATRAAELRNQRDELIAQEDLLGEQIRLAETDLERAERDVARTVIAAPADGVVVSDVAETGDYAAAGMTLLTIQEAGPAEVRCDLTFEDLLLLEEHAAGDSRDASPAGPLVTLPRVPATVRLERAGRTFTWDGRLDGQEGFGLDEATRTITCRVTVDDPEPTVTEAGVRPPLLRGLFVDVLLSARPRRAMLSVPAAALRPGPRLWIDRGGELAIETVDVLSAAGDEVVIAAGGGVSAGDRVVVSPLPRAVPGMKVSSGEASPPAVSASGEPSPDTPG